MTTEKQTSRTFLRTLTIIFFALIIGQVLFGSIVIYLTSIDNITPDPEFETILTYVIITFIFTGVTASHFLYKYFIGKAKEKTTISEKMPAYQTAYIIRHAILEGPTLFCIIVSLVTGNLIFLGVAGLMVLYQFTIRPTISKIETDLELNPSEKEKLNNPDEIIFEKTV